MRLRTGPKRILIGVVGCLVSAVALVVAYPPYGQVWVMPLALTGFFLVLSTARSWWGAALLAGGTGFLANLWLLSWVPDALQRQSEMSRLLCVAVYVGLAVSEQASWAIVAALRQLIKDRFGARPLFWTPAAVFALESLWPRAIPNTFGAVFFGTKWVAQIADVGGVAGLTALLALAGEAGAEAVLWVAQRRTSAAVPKSSARIQAVRWATAAVTLAVAASYGEWRLADVSRTMASPMASLRIAAIQPNEVAELEIREARDQTITRLEINKRLGKLTLRAQALDPEIVFWPEGSVPEPFDSRTRNDAKVLTGQLNGFVATRRIPLMFWTQIETKSHVHPAVVLLMPDPNRSDRAQEQVHREGTGAMVMTGPHGFRLTPMIGREDLDPRLAREGANGGAQFLVSLVNDGWARSDVASEWHLELASFRSIETRRPLIRSSVGGTSTVIDIDGQPRFRSDLNAVESVDDTVPLYAAGSTPFMVWGTLLIMGSALYALSPFGLTYARRRRLSRRGLFRAPARAPARS